MGDRDTLREGRGREKGAGNTVEKEKKVWVLVWKMGTENCSEMDLIRSSSKQRRDRNVEKT